MDIVALITERWVSLGIVAAILAFFFWLNYAIKNTPVQNECSRCKGVWTPDRIVFTGKECLCPHCLSADCDEKTEENYRRAKVTLVQQ